MFTMGFSLGIPELVLVLVIILIIFGPGKLPKIGKAFGEALGGFKKSANAKFDEQEDKGKAAVEATTDNNDMDSKNQ